VLERLRVRHEGAQLVHRLDLDTSGVLLCALDDDAHRALQRQFLQRTVEKRYVAWLEGEVHGDSGTICLPLRVDLEQRPRQLVCFEHGKKAVTDWRVLERKNGRTRIELFPRTGRTHQLRAHAAHARGLNAPIVGDRLYGAGGGRLMLHAESLTFDHPSTRERMIFRCAENF
jgi:tRNA pseudouridine32 synthase/23S rRNA pseudouridine746 synthase